MEKLRRSMLFCPANEPKMYLSAPLFKPDCIIFDLEDAIPVREKDSARALLCEALQFFDFGDIEIFVRINALSTPFGNSDVLDTVAAGIRRIRLPMCETAQHVVELDTILQKLESSMSLPEGCIKIQCAIETPKGVLNAAEIATASQRIISLSFGAEDFTRSLGIERTLPNKALDHARCQLALVCSSLGIDAIDTVWADLKDMAGFEAEVEEAKRIGFKGKSCIHPKQVQAVHKIFNPSPEAVEHSLKVISMAARAFEQGIGVVTVDGKMVDLPVIHKAERIVNLAIAAGMIESTEVNYDLQKK